MRKRLSASLYCKLLINMRDLVSVVSKIDCNPRRLVWIFSTDNLEMCLMSDDDFTWNSLQEDEAGVPDQGHAGPDQHHDVDQRDDGVQVGGVLGVHNL